MPQNQGPGAETVDRVGKARKPSQWLGFAARGVRWGADRGRRIRLNPDREGPRGFPWTPTTREHTVWRGLETRRPVRKYLLTDIV